MHSILRVHKNLNFGPCRPAYLKTKVKAEYRYIWPDYIRYNILNTSVHTTVSTSMSFLYVLSVINSSLAMKYDLSIGVR